LLFLFVLLFKTHTKRVNVALESKCQSTISIQNSNMINALKIFIDFRHWAKGWQLKLLDYCSLLFIYIYCVDKLFVVTVCWLLCSQGIKNYEMSGSVSLLLRVINDKSEDDRLLLQSLLVVRHRVLPKGMGSMRCM
jgi:hypothetical protein